VPSPLQKGERDTSARKGGNRLSPCGPRHFKKGGFFVAAVAAHVTTQGERDGRRRGTGRKVPRSTTVAMAAPSQRAREWREVGRCRLIPAG